MDLLINYCPRCGDRLTKSVINSLGNGGDWVCTRCQCYVEAYVLNKGEGEED